jgi:quercetin dioxygenase-like cupin family protein
METFYVLKGEVRVELLVPPWKDLHEGDSFTLLPGTPHRFWTVLEDGADILEISTPHSDLDVYRIEESQKF